MTSVLYWGASGSLAMLLLSTQPEAPLPFIESMGAGSIALLMWGIKILKSERDQAQQQLRHTQQLLKESELKCLHCDYYQYNKLLRLVLQTETHHE